MEFAELIRISRCDRVMLHRPHHPVLDGTLCITGHHLIVSSCDKEPQELWLLHSNIDTVERRQQGMTGGTLWLKCKDLRILQLDVIGADQFAKVADTLEDLIRVEEPLLRYPFFYRAMYQILEDGWTAFMPESEFSRLVQPGDDWRISYVNKDYKVCPSYPSAVVVPKNIEDNDLIAIANFRQASRFPVLAYRHRRNIMQTFSQAVLLRSGQPLITANGKRCKEDERLLNSVLARDKRGYIIDTRTQNLAQSAKLRGGGYEPELHYPNWRRVHKPIDRHHVLLDSLTKLMDGINDTSSGTDKWLSRLESSSWMNNIKETLNCACLVAQCLDQEGASVLVHDTDGMDSTLQVTSLAQIILNPDCRTVRGLEALIEREWIQGGHPFATRHARSCYTPSTQRSKINSPTFLLFLDCVYQIHHQFSCSFEFAENFLVMLFEHSYSSQFGTFLANNEGERRVMMAHERTASLWSFVNRPEVLPKYLNPMYEPNQRVIWPSVAPMSLQLWASVFLRWVVDQGPQEAAWTIVRELREKESTVRSQVARLRRQLQDLEREAVDVGILTPPVTGEVEVA
ncbi:myotubularin-related protein 9-like [Penaeus chinensis]|uniref:myotubularin-related protein 9-like n=1 Tax=Penaeus chinensis TaxID=139456 RepID=UPI001FB83879|nr:myotubularin-related protein 9-like [Penaeus chinensis]